MKKEKVNPLEAFGLIPIDKALKDAAITLFGKGKILPTLWGVSSLKVFKPWISFPIWLGTAKEPRLTPIYNFVNRVNSPKGEPHSVKVTYARDFMGGEWTYDGHVGTDFAIPVGTRIVTCAPGKVIRLDRQFNHGGLKVYIDHGMGQVTMYEHLSRTFVQEGGLVERGQAIALSGVSGIDMFLFTPWVAPHLHFNVILNGRAADPFATDGEESLWLNRNHPTPHAGARETGFTPTPWNDELISRAIDDCSDPEVREHIRSLPGVEQRAAEVIGFRICYKTLFSDFPQMYEPEYPRTPLLDLPLSAEDYDGALYP